MSQAPKERSAYWCFTGPQRLDKAMHTLEGLMKGIAIDRLINKTEMRRLQDWLDEHREFQHKHPFSEVIPVVDDALVDGRIDPEEHEDIVWLCQRFRTEEKYFNFVCSDMQRLHGVFAGIVADRVITHDELRGLSEWMAEHEHLTSLWPFDEINAFVFQIMRDGRMTSNEHDLLRQFVSEFATYGSHRAVQSPLNESFTLKGFCAVAPEVSFPDRWFCFTGASSKGTRRKLAQAVEARGGHFADSVLSGLHYLVVCDKGNPAWAYCCYGRKVERAIELRRQGNPILIVHEIDFWDAAAE